MAAFSRDGNHALGAESVAVHDERSDYLGHGFALCAVQHGLLLGCQFQNITPLASVFHVLFYTYFVIILPAL